MTDISMFGFIVAGVVFCSWILHVLHGRFFSTAKIMRSHCDVMTINNKEFIVADDRYQAAEKAQSKFDAFLDHGHLPEFEMIGIKFDPSWMVNVTPDMFRMEMEKDVEFKVTALANGFGDVEERFYAASYQGRLFMAQRD